jgi:hypothetical protein
MKGLLRDQHADDEGVTAIRLHDTESRGVIEILLQKRLIVADESIGKPAAPAQVDAPVANITERSHNRRAEFRPSHVWRFFSAAATASMSLRWQSIEATVRTAEFRKSACTKKADAANHGQIAELFEVFTTLRPYYPRPYLCIFDSLALIHFMAQFDVFPCWVYGVKLEPFGAHCWVQVGNLVVNDMVDHVRQYTPIMSI